MSSAGDGLALGTETEYLIFEVFSNLISPDGSIPQRLASPTILADLMACVPDEYVALRADPHRGYLLANGARLYIDTPFLEYATATCLRAKDVLKQERVAELTLTVAKQAYLEKTGCALSIVKMVSSEEGRIAGYHENYGVRRDRYFRLFRPNFWPDKPIPRVLVPFLVARILYTGAGYVDASAGTFELSQRARFIETVYNYTSTCKVPILHLKRPDLHETHLRIQITCGEPNMLEIPTFLKIGTTAIVLACLSQGHLSHLDFELADPVSAFRSLSSGVAALPLRAGRQLPALDLLDTLIDDIRRSEREVEKPRELEWGEIMSQWETIVEKLKRDGYGQAKDVRG